MSANKKLNRPQTIEMFEELQAEQFEGLADPQIEHLYGTKERQRSVSRHQQSSQYLDSSSRNEGFEEYDALLGKLSQFKALDASKTFLKVLTWNASFLRNREKLFKRQRTEQKQEIATLMKEIEGLQLNREQFIGSNMPTCNLAYQKRQYQKQPSNKFMKKEIFIKSINNKTEKLEFLQDDINKLSPGEDLNDTIIEHYLKILKNYFIAKQYSEKIHFFSTFFLPKLIGDVTSAFMDGPIPNRLANDNQNQIIMNKIMERIKENYNKMKRWTKNTDIFEKELLVFPINAFNHWFCVLILHPNNITSKQHPSEFIYCDSMFQKKDLVVCYLKAYLSLELFEKKGKFIRPFQQTVHSYQLLLPRQTNTHDCGLFMLTYIDELLNIDIEKRNSLKFIQNRNQLCLFPRMLTFTMRKRLLRFIEELSIAATQQKVKQICEIFIEEKRQINNRGNNTVILDQINTLQFQKYKETVFFSPGGDKMEQDFCSLIRFYLDAEVNYYEKDNQL